jgi:hypothetical protein
MPRMLLAVIGLTGAGTSAPPPPAAPDSKYLTLHDKYITVLLYVYVNLAQPLVTLEYCKTPSSAVPPAAGPDAGAS